MFPVAISPDRHRLLAGVLGAGVDVQCYLADLADPGRPLQPVTADLDGSFHYPGPWDPDGSGFYIRTTSGGDHIGLARLRLPDMSLTMIDSPPWDVEDVAVSADGRTIAWVVNHDGRSGLRALRDAAVVDAPFIPKGSSRR